MLDLKELQELVLAGICTKEKALRIDTIENIRYAESLLRPQMFEDLYRPIFVLIIKYLTEYNGLIDYEIFCLNVDKGTAESSKKSEYKLKFKELLDRNIRKDKFISSVQLLIEQTKSQMYMKSLQQAVDTFDGTPEGLDKSRVLLDKGLQDMEVLVGDGSEEFDIRKAGKEFLNKWRKNKREPSSNEEYIPFYIPILDDRLGGIGRKHLVFLSGAPGHYKSTLTRNIVYNNLMNGKNVVVGQGEVTTSEFMNAMIALHSTHLKFNLGTGITKDMIKFPHRFKDVKDLEDNLAKVVEDWTTNEAYGKIQVFSFPMNFTVMDLFRKCQRYQNFFNIDLLVIDELRHLAAEKSRQQDREEYTQVVKALDRLVKSFNAGKGLRCVCLHKVNRKYEELAYETGVYPLRSLAESDETAKAANLSIFTLVMPSDKDANELTVGVNKTRDGASDFIWKMAVQPDTGLILEKV